MEDHAALGVDPLVFDRNVIESGSLDAGSDIGSAFLIEIGIHSDIHSVLVFQLDMGSLVGSTRVTSKIEFHTRGILK